MKLNDILGEDHLREWIRENSKPLGIGLQWVEPNIHGSSVGAPDVIMKCDGVEIPIELKLLLRMKKGIKFTLRPSQRRYHHMGMKKGQKSALLFVEGSSNNKLWLVRGDKIPLRDYPTHPASGCEDGKCDMFLVSQSKSDINIMMYLKHLLFIDDIFWTYTKRITGDV